MSRADAPLGGIAGASFARLDVERMSAAARSPLMHATFAYADGERLWQDLVAIVTDDDGKVTAELLLTAAAQARLMGLGLYSAAYAAGKRPQLGCSRFVFIRGKQWECHELPWYPSGVGCA